MKKINTAEGYSLPSTALLSGYINGILSNTFNRDESIIIIRREPLPYRGVNPSEVIYCEASGGRPFSFFCKYGESNNSESGSHRIGVGYEARVYEHLTKHPSLNLAAYYGSTEIGNADKILMLLELLADYSHIDLEDLSAWAATAAWLGNFHKVMEGTSYEFLKVYSRQYYMHWLNQFRHVLEGEEGVGQWIYDTCDFFENNLNVLLAAPLTIIHGEYYIKNVLINDKKICVTDWESAAIAAGETDLAALIDNNKPEVVELCISEYIAARWPDGCYDKMLFEKRLILSRLYYYFRWLSKKKHKGIDQYLKTDWVNVGLRNLAAAACV